MDGGGLMGMGGGSEPEVDTTFQDWSMQQAKRARKEERSRQTRISEGMREIAAIFEGGKTRPMVAARGKFDPNQAYFLDGKRWEPKKPTVTTASGGAPVVEEEEPRVVFNGLRLVGPDADEPGALIKALNLGQPDRVTVDPGGPRKQYRAVKDRLTVRGEKTYPGMEPLLEAREGAMRRYYLPQLRENFGDAKDELTAALADAGLLVSTAANEKRSDLRQDFRRERAGVLADIERDIASTRSGINDQRSAIEAALRASGDASQATDAALRARATFAQDAPEMNPLENTLLGVLQGIGQVRNGMAVGNIKRAAGGGFVDQSRIVS